MGNETKSPKVWYKTWWGVIVAILFLPFFLIYFVWKKTEWKSYIKGLVTAGILLFTFSVMASSGGQTTTPVLPTTQPQQKQVVSEAKEITETEVIPFETQTKDDSTLTKGTTKVSQEGKNGTKEKTYKVTLTDGKETNRVFVSEVVTVQPTSKIVLNGTYVAPTFYGSTGNGYTNVDGNYVQSPGYYSSAPAGATAKCGDGTYSFSQHRSGTCSYHGGVAQWL